MNDKVRGNIPRKIKGFRDIDPTLNQLRWHIIEAARKVYQQYGYEHWDTPAIEYADCLGKYMPDRDTVEEGVYAFNNPEQEPVLANDGKELRDENDHVIMANHPLAMRYDLTAPLARVYAEKHWMQHLRGQFSTKKPPIFRRYQFGPVFRYEAKLDPGRFREFWQLDFDTVGSADVSTDAEACMILSDALEAIGLKRGDYIIKINNRKILKGLLHHIGISTEEQNVLRIIDKMDKIGVDGIAQELGKGRKDESGAFIEGLNLGEDLVSKLIDFLKSFETPLNRHETLDKLKQQIGDNPVSKEGLAELQTIHNILTELAFDESRIIIDPSLVRGMAYYTGPIFEVESLQTYKDEKGRKRRVGSICGGGRYDGLVERLLGAEIPATGASIGVDRLAELLVKTKQNPQTHVGPVLIIAFDDHLMPQYQKIAQKLRQSSIPTEIYYGAQRNLKKQLSYADQKHCPVAILLGEDEMKKGVATVRNLNLGKELADQISDKKEWRERVQKEVPLDELTAYVQKLLA